MKILRGFHLKGKLERPNMDFLERIPGKPEILYSPEEKKLIVEGSEDELVVVKKYLKRIGNFIYWTT
jgi:hypothetical protein